MIWAFWTILGLGIGGMLIMAILARRRRPRRKAVPLLPRLRHAIPLGSLSLLWNLSYPLGDRIGKSRAPDAPKDYTQDFEEQLEEGRRNRSQNQNSPNP
jgi:hypothetical protein